MWDAVVQLRKEARKTVSSCRWTAAVCPHLCLLRLEPFRGLLASDRDRRFPTSQREV